MVPLLFIHRGRNTKSDYLGGLFTDKAALFDYRGSSTRAMLFSAFKASQQIPSARAYLVEGGICFWPAFFKKLFNWNTVIIVMAPEPIFNWRERSFLKNLFLKIVFKAIGYVLPISQLVEDDARHYTKAPSTRVHHYIDRDIAALAAITPSPEKNLLFAIRRPKETGWTKGMDVVFQIFALLRAKDPAWHLYLIGYGTEELSVFDDHIHLEGDQDPLEYFKKCPIILSPSRYDAFSMAAAEACVSGVVPLVSETTGIHSVLREIDSRLVAPYQKPELFADRILQYNALSEGEKGTIQKKLRKAGSLFSKEHSTKEAEAARVKVRTHFAGTLFL